jgi:hypothetical protein
MEVPATAKIILIERPAAIRADPVLKSPGLQKPALESVLALKQKAGKKAGLSSSRG